MKNFDSDYRMLIGGDLVAASATFDVVNPATEEVIAAAPEAGREHLDAATRAARRAFPGWRDTPLAERQRVVAAIGSAIEANAEELMQLLTREQGKPRAGAEWEIGGAAAWCAALADQALDTENFEGDGRHVQMRRVPIGVVGAITPWNFPVLLAIWKIAPALVAGNCIIVKPSPYTPLCTLRLGELLKDIVPAGVLNVVSGGNDLGAWMTGHEQIDKISFTGSTATGRKIMASAASNIKRVTLELGGNDPAIVLADVDPKTIAPQLFWAAFQNSSQFCAAAKRLYIHDDIYDRVRDELVAYARTVKVGDGSHQGTQLGPIQNRMQFDKLKDILADTRQLGVDIPLGGEAMDGPGYFIPVTIVDNPPDDSRIVREEPFGPVLPLLRFTDIDDVIARANDSEYALAASVWSADVGKAKSIAERIEAGTVWINEIHVFAPHIAFGGHKQSGMGVENSLHGLAEYSNIQTITARTLQ